MADREFEPCIRRCKDPFPPILIGEFYEHDAWDEQETVLAFAIRISEKWQKAIESHCGYEETWGVHRARGGTR